MSITKKRPSLVYAIQCSENGKVYVGCTEDFQTRIAAHFAELRGGKKVRLVAPGKREGTQWQKDFDSYGRDAFKVYILEDNIPPADAYNREDYWIEYYDATNPKYGYNFIKGGVRYPVAVEPGIPERNFPADETIIPKTQSN